MSDLLSKFLELAPFAVVGASLLGSSHCLLMCGGIAGSLGDSLRAQGAYHAGRLVSYLSLGALAGYLGQGVLLSRQGMLSQLSLVALGILYIFFGVQIWRGRSPHLFKIPLRYLWAATRVEHFRPFLTGVFASFLPCGWLHVFVLSAVATQSWWRGAGLLFFFWVGTVPALVSAPWLGLRLFSQISGRLPKASALLLIGLGVLSIGHRFAPHTLQNSTQTGSTNVNQQHHCH